MFVDVIEYIKVYHLKAYVESESEVGKYYLVSCRVDEWSCTCPHNTNRNIECKHIKAVKEEVEDDSEN